MKIKSLELQGYKTFATRTVFEFTGEVTAIVGPNGSGKSNITDSLRWVLGEQSFSVLRAKKTEDLIFSGSESRPQSGMASVTIVLDNTDGWLPIDFSEVAITRRAYRDGQNEYLINGQRVRLRDVTELLARSGLAERTYTIVGQGLVDLALSVNAEERRRLFEEAAGIGVYRLRKEEALRRLDTTRRNIDRVKDILAEIEPRLQSLERQARRAREYTQIKKDLMVLLREWYSYHWHQGQKKIAEAREAMRAMEKTLEERKKAISDIEERLSTSRNLVQHYRAEFMKVQKEYFEKKSQLETLARSGLVLNERSQALEYEMSGLKMRVIELRHEIKAIQEEKQSIEQELQRLEAERYKTKDELTHLSQRLESAQKENAGILEVERRIQNALATLMERRTNLEKTISQLVLEKRNLSGEAEAALLEIETQRNSNEEKKMKLLVNQKLLAEANSYCQSLEKEIDACQQKISSAEASIADVKDKLVATHSKIEQLKTQLQVLDKHHQDNGDYVDGTYLVKEASKNDQYHIYGLLYDHLQIPSEVEVAIAAALGEYIEGVLLDQEDLDRVIWDLKSRPAHLTLLSLDCADDNTSLALAKGQKGVIGIAAHLVNAPEGVKPVVNSLLGKVLIVQNHEFVQKELFAFPVTCVVTLDGEVFIKDGPVVIRRGGVKRPFDVRHFEESLVREVNRLEHLSTQLERELFNLEQELSHEQQKKSRFEKELEDLTSRRNEIERGSEQLNRELEIIQHSVILLEDKKDWLDKRIQILTKQIAEMELQKVAFEEEVIRNQTELTGVREALNRSSLNDLQNELAELEKKYSLIERKIEVLQTRQSGMDEALIKASNELEAKIVRCTEIERAREEIKLKAEALNEEEESGKEQLEELMQQVSIAESRMIESDKENEVLQRMDKEARQALSAAEHQFAQSKVTLARAQEALETLRHRIEDDLGLVDFEYIADVSGPTPLPLEGFVEQLPLINELPPNMEEMIKRQKMMLKRLSSVNPEAELEYQQVKERYEFLVNQMQDLHQAEEDIRQVIAELDTLIEREFLDTFEAVSKEFQGYFTRLFGGGSARLLLTDPKQPSTCGVEVEAKLPGRREHGLSLLSGGERSLVAISLIFALIKVSPTPFCVLDEVDAMLDEANTARFRDLLKELSNTTQFVVITHNRNTVEAADVIYGITMGRDSTSQVISLKIDQVSQVV